MSFFPVCSLQLGPNIRELFRLVEDFVDVIGLRMKDFQDMYEVTDNLGEPVRLLNVFLKRKKHTVFLIKTRHFFHYRKTKA